MFVSENFGESELAGRFGVTRYPAIFVGEVLVARPRDFGFLAPGETAGRYTPWRNPASHERFTNDLARMIEMALAGREEDLRRERAAADAVAGGAGGIASAGAAQAAGGAGAAAGVASLPDFRLADLAGRTAGRDELLGRVVVVEFWATWCPPCRSTLGWLGELAGAHRGDLEVLAVAVESNEADVRAFAASGPAVRWAIGTPETSLAFGDILAVPTLFVFDRQGRTAFVAHGAPPDLHEKAGSVIRSLLEDSPR